MKARYVVCAGRAELVCRTKREAVTLARELVDYGEAATARVFTRAALDAEARGECEAVPVAIYGRDERGACVRLEA